MSTNRAKNTTAILYENFGNPHKYTAVGLGAAIYLGPKNKEGLPEVVPERGNEEKIEELKKKEKKRLKGLMPEKELDDHIENQYGTGKKLRKT